MKTRQTPLGPGLVALFVAQRTRPSIASLVHSLITERKISLVLEEVIVSFLVVCLSLVLLPIGYFLMQTHNFIFKMKLIFH